MLMRVKVNFDIVAEDQREIDRRLANWALWCNSSGCSNVSPMFRLYRSPPTRGDCNAGGPSVDSFDAHLIAKGVVQLPEHHRLALAWHYIVRGAPARACRNLGVSMDTLARLVSDARRMLINRKV